MNEPRARGITAADEATALSYSLSARLVGRLGPRRSRDEVRFAPVDPHHVRLSGAADRS